VDNARKLRTLASPRARMAQSVSLARKDSSLITITNVRESMISVSNIKMEYAQNATRNTSFSTTSVSHIPLDVLSITGRTALSARNHGN
jgi:hypothetical protein